MSRAAAVFGLVWIAGMGSALYGQGPETVSFERVSVGAFGDSANECVPAGGVGPVAATVKGGQATFAIAGNCTGQSVSGTATLTFPSGTLTGSIESVPALNGALGFRLITPDSARFGLGVTTNLASDSSTTWTVKMDLTQSLFANLASTCQVQFNARNPTTPTSADCPLPFLRAGAALPGGGFAVQFMATLTLSSTKGILQYEITITFTLSGIDHIELVQSVQDANNSIDMVAKKATFARVFVKGGQGAAGATVSLRGVHNDRTLSKPVLTQVFSPPATIDRNSPQSSANFKLPDDWIAGGVLNVTATLQVPGGQQAVVSSDPLTKNFSAAPQLRIAWLPYCIPAAALADTIDSCPAENSVLAKLDRRIRQAFPLADVSFRQIIAPKQYWGRSVNYLGIDIGFSLPDLKAKLQKWMDAGAALFYDEFVGFLPSGIDLKQGGVAVVGDSDPPFLKGRGQVVAFQYNTPANVKWDDAKRLDYNASGLAHEMAHNFGRHHTNERISTSLQRSCGDQDSETDWKYNTADVQEPGFDTDTIQVIASNSVDLMSYCGQYGAKEWVSPFTYSKLMEQFAARNSSKSSAKKAAASGEQILVSGSVARDGTAGVLDPTYRLPDDGLAPPSVDGGSHCLRFSGPAGSLGDYCFGLSFQMVEANSPLDQEFFSLKAPLPAGTIRIALMTGDREITALTASSSPPVLTVSSPKAGDRWDGGPRTIAWTAADPDGQPLTYAVLYSSDGAQSWLPLVLDIHDSQFSFDPAAIDGGKNVFFRVIATDGLNSTTADVGPIEVAQTPQTSVAQSAVTFGSQPVGQTPELAVTISNPGTGPLTVTSATLDNGDFAVVAGRPPLVVPAGESRDVVVLWTVAGSGSVSATLTLGSNDPANPSAAVRITGVATATPAATGTSKITLSPGSLDFGTVAPGQTKDLMLTISNSGDGTLNVSALRAGGAFAVISPAAPFGVAAGGSAAVTVRFSPASATAAGGSLIIESDDSSQPFVSVLLSGNAGGGVTAGGRIAVTPDHLDFGPVVTGQTKDASVTIRNTGTSTLNITDMVASGAYSVIGTAALTIAPGASADVTVRFSPAASGVLTGNLTFASNDALNPGFTIPLRGAGTSSCTFTLNPVSTSVTAASTAVTLDVTASAAGCAWTNFSNSDWIVITSGPGGTGSGRLAFSVAANPSNVQRTGAVIAGGAIHVLTQAAGATNQSQTDVVIKVDGGTFRKTSSVPGIQTTTAYYVNRLTPPSYPAVLKNVQIYFGDRKDGLAVNAPITVVASTDPNGQPSINGLQYYRLPAAVNALGDFSSYPMPSATINSGDFVAGFIATTPATIHPADIDSDSPARQRSYISLDDAATFSLIDTMGQPGNFGIRATVSVPGSGMPAAGISASPANVDFGSIAPGKTGSQTVTISNGGNAPLIVGGIAASAPFGIVSGSAPFTLAPGANTAVTLNFSPSAAGVANGTLLIASNDPVKGAITVALSGTGTAISAPSISLSPTTLDFGSVAVGQTADRNFTITNAGSAPLIIQTLDLTDPFFLIGAPAVPFTIAPSGQQAITVRIRPVKTGAIVGTVAIFCNDPVRQLARVSLSGTGIAASAPQISLDRSTIAFGNVAVGGSQTAALTISNRGSATLNVTSLSAAAPFSVAPGSLSVAAGASATATITFSPASAGGQSGTLTIVSNDPSTPTLTVVLSGTGAVPVTQPQISVNPASLTFGTVNVGQSQQMGLTISNLGTATLNVTSLSTAAPFSVSPGTLTVAAGASATATVTFGPTSAGAQNGALTIASNDPANGIVSVALTGTGAVGPSSNIVRTLVHHEITRLGRNYTLNNGGWPILSANGNRAVFADVPGPEATRTNHIYVVNADGTGLAQVDSYAQLCGCGAILDLSADGSVVVSTDGEQLRIAGTGGARQLIRRSSIIYIRITPDGRKVFFVFSAGSPSPNDPTTERGVYVINADGSGLRQLASPAAIAAKLGTTADRVGLGTSGPPLDISADGTRMIFGATANGQDHLFAANADGTGLREVALGFTFLNRAVLSANGSKIGYNIATYGQPNEIGTINFDGSGRRVLATNLDIGPLLSISASGSQLLAGYSGRLYSTDGSGVVQLSVQGTYSATPLIIDGLNRPTMNGAGNRVLYQSPDSAGILQLVVMDINPSSLGAAPQLSDPSLSPDSVRVGRVNASTLTVTVNTSSQIQVVSESALLNGLNDIEIAAVPLTAASGGVYTTDRITASSTAAPGPRIIRIKAEVTDAAGVRHATAIDFGTLQVQP